MYEKQQKDNCTWTSFSLSMLKWHYCCYQHSWTFNQPCLVSLSAADICRFDRTKRLGRECLDTGIGCTVHRTHKETLFSLPEPHKLKASWKPKISITAILSAVVMYVSSFWFIIDPVGEVSKAVIILYCKIKTLHYKFCTLNNIGVKVCILQCKIACCATYYPWVFSN